MILFDILFNKWKSWREELMYFLWPQISQLPRTLMWMAILLSWVWFCCSNMHTCCIMQLINVNHPSLNAQSNGDLFPLWRKKGVECIEKYVLISNVMISKGNFVFAFYSLWNFTSVKGSLHSLQYKHIQLKEPTWTKTPVSSFKIVTVEERSYWGSCIPLAAK